jgi:hypothetical protein
LFLGFIFLSLPPLGLDVVYHLGYFYVMYCECGDNDGYRCQHRNAWQLRYIKSMHIPRSNIHNLCQKNGGSNILHEKD